jgi:hypothetical protein
VLVAAVGAMGTGGEEKGHCEVHSHTDIAPPRGQRGRGRNQWSRRSHHHAHFSGRSRRLGAATSTQLRLPPRAVQRHADIVGAATA